MMEFKLRRMAGYIGRCHHDGAKRESFNISKAAMLCRRMGSEDYNAMDCKKEDYLYNQDLELLGKIFRKHLRCWWD